jgi:hypothetical protein
MIALWALRVLVIILSAMVIYTFFSQLGSCALIVLGARQPAS